MALSKNMTRKPRCDAKLLNLPEERREKLVDWLLSGASYDQTRDKVQKEWSFSCSNRSLHEFWDQVCVPTIVSRRTKVAEDAKAITNSIEPGETIDAASVALVQQRLFELLRSTTVDPSAVRSLFTLLLRIKNQELLERRIELLERKADQAEKVPNEPSLTPEEYRERMREIVQR